MLSASKGTAFRVQIIEKQSTEQRLSWYCSVTEYQHDFQYFAISLDPFSGPVKLHAFPLSPSGKAARTQIQTTESIPGKEVDERDKHPIPIKEGDFPKCEHILSLAAYFIQV